MYDKTDTGKDKSDTNIFSYTVRSKKMKKVLSIVLCLILVMAMFTACGGEKKEAAEGFIKRISKEITYFINN